MEDGPSQLSDVPSVELPSTAGKVAADYATLWEAYQNLGFEVASAGPLDERTRRLVHIAYAVGVASEGATHSHARRALAEGVSPAELEHVALLAITTIGWPQAVRALTWIRDVTRPA